MGRGRNKLEFGLRLREEITRAFALYIGVSWADTVGQTAEFTRIEHEVGRTSASVSARCWYERNCGSRSSGRELRSFGEGYRASAPA